MKLFFYALAGFMVSMGLFLRVQTILNRAIDRPAYGKYWNLLLRFAGLGLLSALILLYKDDNLFLSLGIFFGTALLTLLCTL